MRLSHCAAPTQSSPRPPKSRLAKLGPVDLMVANDNINRSGKAYTILNESLSPENYGVGFRKADLALMNKVQSTLEAMATDGTIAAISKKWFGEDISIVGK